MAQQGSTRRGIVGLMAGMAGAMFASGKAHAASGPDNTTQELAPPASDRLAILELIALYAWAYDTEDAELLAQTFTPDGILEVFGDVFVSGRAGWPAFIEQARDMKGEHGWQHLTDHHVFRDYDGNSCTVYSYYTMAQSNAKGGDVTMRAMGYYVSDCVRSNGKWLFAKRAVVRWNSKLPFSV